MAVKTDLNRMKRFLFVSKLGYNLSEFWIFLMWVYFFSLLKLPPEEGWETLNQKINFDTLGSCSLFGIHGGSFLGSISKWQFFWLVQKWVSGSFFYSTRRQNWLLPQRHYVTNKKAFRHAVYDIKLMHVLYTFLRAYIGEPLVTH